MIKKLLISACLVGTGILASGVGASAGSNLCERGQGCIYDNNNYSALLGTKAGGAGLSNVSSGSNDKTDSWENKSSRNGAWFYDSNAGGNCASMTAGDENPNLSVFPSDELSSWRMKGGC